MPISSGPRSLAAALAVLALLGPAARAPAADVAASAQEARPLSVGAALPDATVRALDGSELALSSLVGSKPLLLIFYRGGW